MPKQDPRNIVTGWEIPSEGYCDQPFVAINDDGSWTVVMTTGAGHEGDTGQHVVSARSTDQGRTWSDLVDIEPAAGPEASWALPLAAPGSGRVYAFYTYNFENRREVLTVDGKPIKRVDSFGSFAYRYSEDGGLSWSADRYEIPMRLMDIDRENVYGGEVIFFWGVGKPFIHNGAAFVCASKVGGFGRGFFVSNEGVAFRSPNLLTEPDPSKHVWETLPEGEAGLRTPPGGGPIAGEFNATPMNDGSLYGTYRTIDGFACHAYSRDDGKTWEPQEYMTYTPGGRRVKNPRAANFVRRFSNGKYLYWYHFHGGEVLGNAPDVAGGAGYGHRNPAWLCGGIERNGHIYWSQPEIVLYDDDIGTRMSYPDFVEQDGEYFISKTQKTVARTMQIDPTLLEGMWRQGLDKDVVTDGLVASWAGGDSLDMPELPLLWQGGGFALDLWVTFASLKPQQILLDSRDAEGRGMVLATTDRKTLELRICGRTCGEPGGKWAAGLTTCAWECDYGVLKTGSPQHLAFIVDGGPKIISVLVDGVLCDGGQEKQYGWGRFHPALKEANGAAEARIAPSLDGELQVLRLYDRYLRSSEAVANYHAGQ